MQQASDRVVDARAQSCRAPVGRAVRPYCTTVRRIADARIAAAGLQVIHSALGE